MKILFITPYVPSRIRVRPFHIIRELARRHEVHVIALGEGGKAEATASDSLGLGDLPRQVSVVPHGRLRGTWQALMALPTRSPMCAAYCRSRRMRRAVEAALAKQRFDLIHVEHLRAAHFVPRGSGIPTVFDSVDCLTGLFRQMAHSKRNPVSKLVMLEETWKLERHEPRVLNSFDSVIATSESERRELLRLEPSAQVTVIPNGVDTSYFAPQGAERRPTRLVFSGKMGYAPNAQAVLWFAQNVLPLLRSKFPAVEFVIVGSDPPEEVRRLASAPGITVTGFVEDNRPHLDSAFAAVVPMQIAVGVQNKALEAMSMALPVVATPIAARAFPDRCPGLLVAGSAAEMASRVSRLIENPAEAARLGSQGRKLVARHFSWESSVAGLERIYQELLVKGRPSRPGPWFSQDAAGG